MSKVFRLLVPTMGYNQATLIGGGGVFFKISPQQKILKIPHSENFGEKFRKNRENLGY